MNALVSPPWRRTAQGVIVRCCLQPRAAQNRLVGLHSGLLKIALTAPPVDNAANKGLLAFLASRLGLPQSSLSLLLGGKSREKHVLISTPTPDTIMQSLTQLLLPVDKKSPDD